MNIQLSSSIEYFQNTGGTFYQLDKEKKEASSSQFDAKESAENSFTSSSSHSKRAREMTVDEDIPPEKRRKIIPDKDLEPQTKTTHAALQEPVKDLKKINPSLQSIFQNVKHLSDDLATDYPIYVVPNEYNRTVTYNVLKTIHDNNFYSKFSKETKNVIIAVSGFFILNVVSTIDKFETGIVLVDNSYVCKNMWESVVEIVKRFPRQQALAEIFKHIHQNADFYYSPEWLGNIKPSDYAIKEFESLKKTIQLGTSFFSSDKQYEVIKAIFQKGNFFFVQQDITDQSSMRNILRVIYKNGYKCPLIYLSNLGEWLPKFQLINYNITDCKYKVSDFKKDAQRLFSPIFIESYTTDSRLNLCVRFETGTQEITDTILTRIQKWNPLATLLYPENYKLNICKFLTQNEKKRLAAACKTMHGFIKLLA